VLVLIHLIEGAPVMNRLWRTAGVLCIAHPVLLLAGYSQMRSPSFGAIPSAIADAYAGVPGTKMYLGGYLATIAWFALIVLVTLLARLLRGTGDTAGWLAGLIQAAGVTAASVTLAGAFASAGAAYYGARHGYGPDVVAGAHYVAKFADFISMVGLGLCAVAIGGAGLASRALPRWAAGLSLAVGALGIASGANSGLLNLTTLVWLAWLVLVGVVLMRGQARARQAAPAPAQAALADVS
jgi:hypothetical protein